MDDDQQMTDYREEQVRNVLAAQMRLRRALHRVSIPSWIELHLSIVQLKALVVLAERERSIGELGETLRIGKPAASILVDKLVQLELVQRTEDTRDRRHKLVSVTVGGEAAISDLLQGGQDRFRGWLRQMDDHDLTSFERGLAALTEIVQAESPAMEMAPN